MIFCFSASPQTVTTYRYVRVCGRVRKSIGFLAMSRIECRWYSKVPQKIRTWIVLSPPTLPRLHTPPKMTSTSRLVRVSSNPREYITSHLCVRPRTLPPSKNHKRQDHCNMVSPLWFQKRRRPYVFLAAAAPNSGDDDSMAFANSMNYEMCSSITMPSSWRLYFSRRDWKRAATWACVRLGGARKTQTDRADGWSAWNSLRLDVEAT